MKQKIMSSTILTNETGRSMVEMLGVLAIVGVLSVGGVYGYGVAMKKHKANELLHQASMLATTISAQAMSNDGKLPETITDFGSTSYGKFPTIVGETADKTGFTITISELDGSVCSQLKEGGMVQKVECNETAKTAIITYYKNLATNDEEGKNSPTGGTTEPVDLCVNIECPEGLTCFLGQCKCPDGLLPCKDQCCAEGAYCAFNYSTNEIFCMAPQENGECKQNSDCKDQEGNVDTTKYCSVYEMGGYCRDKGILTSKTLNLPKGALTVYKSSEDGLTSWDVYNLCKAHGKQMVTMSDLGISDPAGKSECYFDHGKADDENRSDYKCICSGDSGCVTTKTELYDKLGIDNNPWLADYDNLYGAARVLYLDSGTVSSASLGYSYLGYSAICR